MLLLSVTLLAVFGIPVGAFVAWRARLPNTMPHATATLTVQQPGAVLPGHATERQSWSVATTAHVGLATHHSSQGGAHLLEAACLLLSQLHIERGGRHAARNGQAKGMCRLWWAVVIQQHDVAPQMQRSTVVGSDDSGVVDNIRTSYGTFLKYASLHADWHHIA